MIASKKILYSGLVFDSQLEADWYATLQSWGMKVEHHPGRIQLETGWWEPDFLVDGETMAEVKGPSGDRLWKAEEASDKYELPVVVLRPGLVVPGSDNETAGAVWHGTKMWGLEWVLDFSVTGEAPVFTQRPNGGIVRVSAERCVTRPEATGIGMRKALGQEVTHNGN